MDEQAESIATNPLQLRLGARCVRLLQGDVAARGQDGESRAYSALDHDVIVWIPVGGDIEPLGKPELSRPIHFGRASINHYRTHPLGVQFHNLQTLDLDLARKYLHTTS